MPVFEFDELADERVVNGEHLLNYWGYNTVCYFAPNTAMRPQSNSTVRAPSSRP